MRSSIREERWRNRGERSDARADLADVAARVGCPFRSCRPFYRWRHQPLRVVAAASGRDGRACCTAWAASRHALHGQSDLLKAPPGIGMDAAAYLSADLEKRGRGFAIGREAASRRKRALARRAPGFVLLSRLAQRLSHPRIELEPPELSSPPVHVREGRPARCEVTRLTP